MDPFHERLARLALAASADYGFCLAGGYAVQAHGFVDRISKDVDLHCRPYGAVRPAFGKVHPNLP